MYKLGPARPHQQGALVLVVQGIPEDPPKASPQVPGSHVDDAVNAVDVVRKRWQWL